MQGDDDTTWILGNQLPHGSTMADRMRPGSRVLMIEASDRARRYPYHKLKLVLLYSAMRHHARVLESKGCQVDYYPFTSTDSFLTAIREHVRRFNPVTIHLQQPSEYPAMMHVKQLQRVLEGQVSILMEPNDLFLVDLPDFLARAKGKARLIMEAHYRRMRKKHGILMDAAGAPEGGKWNYDQENRLGYASGISPPDPPRFEPDTITREVMAEVDATFPTHPGNVENFAYPVTREDAIHQLEDFIEHRLDLFGPYEDTMVAGQPFMYHSVLAPLLNIGLLHPREVVERVVNARADGKCRLQSTEAMVRQVIGWREFIRGAYWARMPSYRKCNHFEFHRALPSFFWDGNTTMNCLHEVITQVLLTGFAHHIQRLMVVANFCTLAGIEPREVLRWFMASFIDAYDWVMIPNVHGMGIHADGGFIATKPYISSGAYIKKMSNYCKECAFNVEERLGNKACPFNYLFWHFLHANQDKLRGNPRNSLLLAQLKKKSLAELASINEAAMKFLSSLA
ncbi:MAG: cryptochrome/photolyase family protein [Candidatus Lokiarchaeota archaeon]|nr:cryptochrome/photolyase family protein [Candidatus Lokiarchaeota archaeon]